MMVAFKIYGESSEEHDAKVRTVFRHLEDNDIALVFYECEFAKSSITYLGNVVSAVGIRANPYKVRAIKQMQQPKEVGDIYDVRFHRMPNQQGKFISNLPTVTQPPIEGSAAEKQQVDVGCEAGCGKYRPICRSRTNYSSMVSGS